MKAGINTSWEFNPYSPCEFNWLSLFLIISLFSVKFWKVGEILNSSSFINAVLIAKNDKEKFPPLDGVKETYFPAWESYLNVSWKFSVTILFASNWILRKVNGWSVLLNWKLLLLDWINGLFKKSFFTSHPFWAASLLIPESCEPNI